MRPQLSDFAGDDGGRVQGGADGGHVKARPHHAHRIDDPRLQGWEEGASQFLAVSLFSNSISRESLLTERDGTRVGMRR